MTQRLLILMAFVKLLCEQIKASQAESSENRQNQRNKKNAHQNRKR
jgi:hypothetical protein